MKRLLAFGMTLVMLGLLLPISASLADSTAVIVGGWLRLRSAPSESASTIASYPAGTMVTVFSTNNGWSSVQAPDGRNGYMRSAYLSTTGSAPSYETAASFTAYVTSPNGLGVALRSGSGLNYGIIAYYDVGTAVKVLSVGSVWDRVQIGSTVGYMMAKYLSGTKPSTPVTPVASTTYTAYVTSQNGRGVNLRTGAGTAYGIIGTYPVGTQLTILSAGSVWDYVQIGNIKGYMMVQYITASQPASPVVPVSPVIPSVPAKGTAYVTSVNGKPVRLRSGPGTNYGILGAYPVGTAVTVNETGSIWSRITVGNMSGYMMTAFLTNGSIVPQPAPQVTAEPDPFIVYNGYVNSGNGGNVLLRLNPSSSGTVLDSYAVGTELTVLKVSGNWAYVAIGGRTGWMMLQFITTVKPDTGSYKLTGVSLSTYTPQVGQVITASAEPSGSTAQYIWHHENGNIVCYNASYSITKIDAGHKLYCTAFGNGKWSGEINSGMTSAVVDMTPPSPLSGSIVLPSNIYADTTISIYDLTTNTLPTSDISCTWQINGATVANGISVYIQSSYVGKDLRLIVTANSTSGYTGSVGSNYVIIKAAASKINTVSAIASADTVSEISAGLNWAEASQGEILKPETASSNSSSAVELIVPEMHSEKQPLVERIVPNTVQTPEKLSGSVYIPSAAVPGTTISVDLSNLPIQNVSITWYLNGSMVGSGSSIYVPAGNGELQVIAAAEASSGYTGAVSSNICLVQNLN